MIDTNLGDFDLIVVVESGKAGKVRISAKF